MIRFKAVYNRKSIIAEGVYRKTYQKGSIVEAEPDTFGIMTFNTHKNTLAFLVTAFGPISSLYKIIKVKPIGRGRKVEHVSTGGSERSISFFYRAKQDRMSFSDLCTIPPPKGTVCYKSVEVLE